MKHCEQWTLLSMNTPFNAHLYYTNDWWVMISTVTNATKIGTAKYREEGHWIRLCILFNIMWYVSLWPLSLYYPRKIYVKWCAWLYIINHHVKTNYRIYLKILHRLQKGHSYHLTKYEVHICYSIDTVMVTDRIQTDGRTDGRTHDTLRL